MTNEKIIESAENREVEAAKNNLLIQLTELTAQFFRDEQKTNDAVTSIVHVVAERFKTSNNEPLSDQRILELIATIKKSSGSNEEMDLKSLNLGLSMPSLAELGKFIESVGEFIKYEKKTFLAILLLLFCKKSACECICTFINKD